ncbi:hypothetical protein [Evansella clarkii]|uniref:hypothetical protein n=1 Tax=Evansella clarkii TaxID=79879 RepID=UPI000997C37D|nr:hypothetical protein [Evansella clarkii]
MKNKLLIFIILLLFILLSIGCFSNTSNVDTEDNKFQLVTSEDETGFVNFLDNGEISYFLAEITRLSKGEYRAEIQSEEGFIVGIDDTNTIMSIGDLKRSILIPAENGKISFWITHSSSLIDFPNNRPIYLVLKDESDQIIKTYELNKE